LRDQSEYDFELTYLVHSRRIADVLDAPSVSHDLTFVHEGSLEYIIGGVAFTVSAGQGMYCPKGVMRYRQKSSAPARYTSMNFLCHSEKILPLPYHITRINESELQFDLKRMLQIYASDHDHYKERLAACVTLIVYGLIDANTETERHPIVEQIKEMIYLNLSRRLTLEEIARNVHLYPTYCSTLFKKITGQTISEFSLEQRINYAARMLTETEFPIHKISEDAGFCDVYYFSRMFKKMLGVTPSSYRAISRKRR